MRAWQPAVPPSHVILSKAGMEGNDIAHLAVGRRLKNSVLGLSFFGVAAYVSDVTTDVDNSTMLAAGDWHAVVRHERPVDFGTSLTLAF